MLSATATEEAINAFRGEVESISALPSIPTVVGKVLQLINSPNSTARQVGEIISRDPSLAAKLLRVANSAFYGMARQIASLDFAIVVLGMSKVRDLVLSVSVMKSFRDVPESGALSRARFWEHCASCALIAQHTAARVGLNLGHEAFVCGLVHDIGKIVLDNSFHDRFCESWEIARERNVCMYEAEAEVFGASHAEVGAWLAEKWSFPESVCAVVAHHHAPLEADPVNRPLVCVCHIADALTVGKERDLGDCPDEFVLEDDPAWQYLQETAPACAALDVERMFFELDQELARVRELLQLLEEPGGSG